MTDAAQGTPALEMQLLTAQDGTAYLLPRALVEAGRLTPEEAAAFREAAGDDVQGLMLTLGPSLGLSLASLSAGSALSSMAEAQQLAMIARANAMLQQQMSTAQAMQSHSQAQAERINSI